MSAAGTMLSAALDYAGRGIAIVPLWPLAGDACSCSKGADCRSPGKHPTFEGWQNLGSTTEETIRRWWHTWPGAGIGSPTGKSNGVAVLDVDPRNGGLETLALLEEQHGPLPMTPRLRSGSGGTHYRFKHPGDQHYAKLVLGPGLELLLDGQQSLLPPSRNGAGPYAWEVGLDDAELAPLPAWIVARLVVKLPDGKAPGERHRRQALKPGTAPTRKRSGLPLSIEAKAFFENGAALQRDGAIKTQRDTLVAAVVSAWGAGDDVEVIRARCWQAISRSPVGDPGWPWTREDVDAIVDDVLSREATEPRSLEESGVLTLGGRQISGPSRDEAEQERRPPEARTWPEPVGEYALQGLVGETVRAMAPYTEADPHALLINLLTAFGCALNSGPHMLVGGTVHTPRLFAVLVGTTARGKKGDSWNIVSRLFRFADERFYVHCIQAGLSSGEGLIAAVRDPEFGLVKGEQVLIAPGVDDKRLLVVEPEFGRVLSVMRREGSTLSAVLRAAWDHGDLRVMTKSQLRATGAHICVLGQITPDELRGGLGETWIVNGFANRFLWIGVRRSRPLAWPEPFDGEIVRDLGHKWARALEAARRIGRMEWAPEGRALWGQVYPDLGPDRTGMIGSLIARGAPCSLRLAMAYASMGGQVYVDELHLRGALDVWGYSERTVEYIWAELTGDPMADAVLGALRRQAELTRTEIRDLFSRNEPGAAIDTALDILLAQGLAVSRRQLSGGRPIEIWSLVPKP